MHGVLVPVDGSVHAIKAIHIACDLCEKYGGNISLFHSLLRHKAPNDFLALKASEAFGPGLTEALTDLSKTGRNEVISENVLFAIGRKVLKVGAEQVHRRGVDVVLMDIGTGDPVEGILAAAMTSRANTIVMGCRGIDNGEDSFGSVSHSVFAKAACTCIAVK